MEQVILQDEKWEFDAPKFMDFERLGSPGMEDVHADTWFDTSATKGLASPESGSGEDPVQQLQLQGGCKEQGESGMGKENQPVARGPGVTKQAGAEGKQQVRAVLAHICGNTTPMTRQMAKKAALTSLQSGVGYQQGRGGSVKKGQCSDSFNNPVRKKEAGISIYEPVVHGSHAKASKTREAAGANVENLVSNAVAGSNSSPQKPVTRSQTRLPTPPGNGQGQNLVVTPVPVDVTCSEKESKLKDVGRTDKVRGNRVKERQQKTWTNKLTVPKSPMLRSKQRCNSQRGKHIKSSEELELEEIAKKKKEAQKMRKKSQRYIESSLRGSSRLTSKPLASTGNTNKRRPLTVPKEPTLRTSKRQRTMTAAAAPVPNLITSHGAGFTMGSRNKAAEASQREKRQREQAARSGPVTRSQVKPRLTRPKTPNFATKRRARAPRYKTSEEIELEQIAQYKPFHPRPITRSMTEQPKQVVKARKALTVPQPFSFATDKRATRKPPAMPSDPPMFVFGAEGPVTRSRAKQTTTSRPTLKISTMETNNSVSRGSNISSASESTKSSEKISAPKLSVGGASLGRTGGSLLRGGAVRVLQPATEAVEDGKDQAVAEKEELACSHADPDLFKDLVDGVHDFIKVCVFNI